MPEFPMYSDNNTLTYILTKAGKATRPGDWPRVGIQDRGQTTVNSGDKA